MSGRAVLRCLSLTLVLAPFAPAAEPVPPPAQPDRYERGLLAETYTKEKLHVWQQRLSLADWKISIAMTRRGELKPKTLGHIAWDKEQKTAVIQVLDASEYTLPFQEMLDDMEFTVVHELIHLELASLPRSEASRYDEEHAVNHIAEALLQADRRK